MTSIARRVAIMQWSPRRLGSGLYAAWDPEERASLTLSGGAVSTWVDYVNGVAPTQALGASRPAYGTSGFNSRPIITPDGVDDQLTLTGVPSSIPTGASSFEVWCVWNQTALVADTTTRCAITWGGIGAGDVFALQRRVISGANRAGLYVGNGTTGIQPVNLSVDLSGRRIVRGIVDGVATRVDVDGVAGSALAAVPAISTTRLRIFANALNAPGAFGAGDFSGIFITRLLSAGEVVNMYAYCNKRIV